MTAHHAVMIVNVSEVEPVPEGRSRASVRTSPPCFATCAKPTPRLDSRPPLELFHEAQHHFAEGQALYALGQLDLRDRAKLDELFYAIANAVRPRLLPAERAHRQALDDLDEKLVDKYFVNFSVFESVPDIWAIDQIFPIVPISRLDEEPTRRGVIADLTCDSDGRIDHYVDAEGVDVSLPLHGLEEDESYLLGIFMVGAYQETLGDIHNLFGDTDAVNVRATGSGYEFAHIRRGDTTDLMLDYVGYDLKALRQSYAKIASTPPASRARRPRSSPRRWKGTDRLHLPRRNQGPRRMTLKAAFIGLGAMGAPMAGHLHAKGLLVAVGNRTQSRADALARDLGVDLARSRGHRCGSRRHRPVCQRGRRCHRRGRSAGAFAPEGSHRDRPLDRGPVHGDACGTDPR